MARITEFFESSGQSRTHPTEVECGYRIVTDGSRRFLQLHTYGSRDRASGPGVNQSLQLDRERARELVDIIRRAFPDLSLG